MSFTLGDVKVAVQARGYGSDTTAAQSELAEARLRRLYSARRWSFLETTAAAAAVAGTATVALPTVQRVDAVRLSFGTEHIADLDFMPQKQLRALWYEDRTPDLPRYWTLDRSNGPTAPLLLWPVPDKAYTVDADIIAAPTIPADDVTPVAIMPDAFLDLIVFGVCQDLAARQRDWTAAAYFQTQHDQLFREVLGRYNVQQRQTPGEVERWDGWEDVER